ncbi:MAG: ABC transporter ATP-binding protein [Paracoccaceae bacterium]|nr:ABC transporter ATP-binding protein [Paracoccaceae bacterium]
MPLVLLSLQKTNMLEVKNLSVFYGRIKVVHSIDFSVKKGSCVALLGPNGAGKTSTISSILGTVSSSGSIRFLDKDISKMHTEERVKLGISIAPEGRRVFSNLSVFENLFIGSAIREDRKAADEEINAWLKTFPILDERRDQAAGTLSGGEQQMLTIARALMSRPKILLLDEPSLGLAPRITRQVFELIQDLKAQGMTILLVEQNATEALKLADFSFILNSGNVIASGSSEEILNKGDLMSSLTGVEA